MPPRDKRQSSPLLWDARAVREEDDEEHDATDGMRGWKQRLVVRLKEYWFGRRRRRGDDRSEESPYARWIQSTGACVVAAFLLYKMKNNPQLKRRFLPLLLALTSQTPYSKARDSSLTQLQSAARDGNISKALIGPNSIVFLTRGGQGWNRTRLPQNSRTVQSEVLDWLQKAGCDVAALPESVWSRLATPLLAALPFVYLAFMYKVLKNLNGGGDMKTLENPNPSTSFRDVAGLDSILQDVRELVTYLKEPQSFRALGAQPPRGVLLHGPPGGGKTLIAQAVAGEAQCDAFLACSGSDFCEMYVGRGAARVRSLFAQARSMAQRTRQRRSLWPLPLFGARARGNRPATAILFIDELDALAKSRSYGAGIHGNDERDQTLNQLLTEMDGFPSQESDVTIIVIAATNRADVLDPAILRRFDRQIQVPYPSMEGRIDILRVHAGKTCCDLSTIDWVEVAECTPNFSGSDLKNVVNDAALLAVREKCGSVEQRHFLHAARRAVAMRRDVQLLGSGLIGSRPDTTLWYTKDKR